MLCFLFTFRLRIAFLPMLLHLHQSQLDFLISFFGEKSSSIDQSTGCPQDPDLFVKKSNNLAGHAIANEALLPYFQASVDEFIFVLHVLASFLNWICIISPFFFVCWHLSYRCSKLHMTWMYQHLLQYDSRYGRRVGKQDNIFSYLFSFWHYLYSSDTLLVYFLMNNCMIQHWASG